MCKICICSSMRHKELMLMIAKELTFSGNLVFHPMILEENIEITEAQLDKLMKAHFAKIELSDIVYIIVVNNEIGEGVQKEIDYAKSLSKEIVYHHVNI